MNAVDLSKGIPRNLKLNNGLQCNVNYHNIPSPIGKLKSGITFSKMLAHNYVIKKADDSPQEVGKKIDIQTLVKKRIATPNFSYALPKFRKGQQLPSYMENVHSRMSINALCFEMLKSNGYSEYEENPMRTYNNRMHMKDPLFITKFDN